MQRCDQTAEWPRLQAHFDAEGCALDLREASFPVGDVALTGTHHVPSMLRRVGVDAFELLVFSTYAHDQLDTVLDAALEYGVALQLA